MNDPKTPAETAPLAHLDFYGIDITAAAGSALERLVVAQERAALAQQVQALYPYRIVPKVNAMIAEAIARLEAITPISAETQAVLAARETRAPKPNAPTGNRPGHYATPTSHIQKVQS